jgi:uncharacterized membrane protein HdeD (DUF308 family)
VPIYAFAALQRRAGPPRLEARRIRVLRRRRVEGSDLMLVVGIICLILGFILSIPVLWTIGIILAVIGVILWIMGAMDHAVLGRRYWY